MPRPSKNPPKQTPSSRSVPITSPADSLWFKDAIIYQLHVRSFCDSTGDGIGDFEGLTARLDYLAGLGVTCIWLLPFYASPDRDNGYDITDYYNVDPRLGTLGDFVDFTHQASERGIRVIVDLVVNHTSNQHPWFRNSRRSRDEMVLASINRALKYTAKLICRYAAG